MISWNKYHVKFLQVKEKTKQITIIILCIFEFFTPALADCLPLEFEWQQVSLSLQDYSQYSGWS